MGVTSLSFTSDNFDHISVALSLIWREVAGDEAKYYQIAALTPDEVKTSNERGYRDDTTVTTMVLSWASNESLKKQGHHQLPVPLDSESSADLLKAWLKKADYPKPPNIDGDVVKGYRIFTDWSAHFSNNPYAFVAIQPAWILYGK